ncbi:MAG: serine protease [Miltoncostaeaceae bacterium]
MPVRRLLLGLLCALVAPLGLGAAGALGPGEDLAGDPLSRGATVALPSVYRVDVTLRIPRVRTARGQVLDVPHGDAIAERGTATAVAPDGVLVSAAHLVDPSPTAMARIGYQRWQAGQGVTVSDIEAREWVAEASAVSVGGRVLAIRVTQADPGTGLPDPRRWTGRLVRTASYADLSLLRIDAPGAPALELTDVVSLGTPIVTIGYGRGEEAGEADRPSGRPALRRGRLEQTGLLADPRRTATVVSTATQRGDSGGPAVDGDGTVRGIVVLRGEGGGIIEQVGPVRRLLEESGIEAGEGETGRLWRAALRHLWSLDLDTARSDLAAVQSAFPDHTLARAQTLRAAGLAGADYRLAGEGRWRSLAFGIGILSLILALACAARLSWLSSPGRGGRR